MDEVSPFDAIREFEFDGTSYKMADLTVLEDEGPRELDRLTGEL